MKQIRWDGPEIAQLRDLLALQFGDNWWPVWLEYLVWLHAQGEDALRPEVACDSANLRVFIPLAKLTR